MTLWLLTGNYGTFEIERIVEAVDEQDAFKWTGIMTDLEAVGWTIVTPPDGESWTVEAIES